ncbi:MAG: acetoacetate decarboxylase family protein [Acidimicrobiia bacterium]
MLVTDPSQVYTMPLIVGPVFDRQARPGRVYWRLETLAASFRTDRDAVLPLVPDCFEVPQDPMITISFGDYDQVDFMAGGGYRVAYAGVSARFEGEETVDGLHILVMWENETLPIVTGRELIGIPKMHADISPIRGVVDDTFRATAAVWGHEVMRIEATTFRKQNVVVRRTAQKRVNSVPWLGYKYIASFDGPPDAAYPTIVWNEAEIDELWFAEHAEVGFGHADEADLGQLAGIPRVLSGIPLGELVFASRARGSAVLALNRSHRLE